MANYAAHTPEGECIFCKIIKKEMETAGIFWEDEKHMAFLSLFPNTKGFTVVITKEHLGSDVMEMEEERLKEFVAASKKVSAILKEHFDDVGRIGVMMEGTGIDHAHIKLFPMHDTKYLMSGEWKQCLSTQDKYFETYEGYLCSNDGPKADEEELRKLAEELRKLT